MMMPWKKCPWKCYQGFNSSLAIALASVRYCYGIGHRSSVEFAETRDKLIDSDKITMLKNRSLLVLGTIIFNGSPIKTEWLTTFKYDLLPINSHPTLSSS